MTPVQGWTEHDYYRASRAARKAWERTNSQLTIGGLEGGDDECRVVTLEPALQRRRQPVTAAVASPGGGLNNGAEPHHGRCINGDSETFLGHSWNPVAVVAPASSGASAPSASTAPGRATIAGVRGRGR